MNFLTRSTGCLLLAVLCLSACNDKDEVITPTFQERITFTADRQYPEGITYSPTLGQFVVTSITQGKVGTVNEAGQYADLFTDDQLISGIGIKEYNGKLYVCNGDQGVSSKSTSSTKLFTAGLLVYNLSTRQVERRTNLAALIPGTNHFANDVAIDRQGVAYITDSFAPVVYRVGTDGTGSILVQSELFTVPSGQFGLNGIVYHPDNYLIVAKAATGQLYKINLGSSNAVTEITGFTALPSADGMTLVGNNLYVVNSRNQVTQLQSSDNWSTATAVRTDASGYDQATTNTEVNGQIYTLNARIGEVSAAAMSGNPASLTASSYSIQRFTTSQ